MNTLKKVSIAVLGATVVAFGVGKSAEATVFFNPDTGHYYEGFHQLKTEDNNIVPREKKSPF